MNYALNCMCRKMKTGIGLSPRKLNIQTSGINKDGNRNMVHKYMH